MRVDKNKWEKVKFAQVGDSELGKTLNSITDTGDLCPYLCAINVLQGKFDLSTIKECRIEERDKSRYLLKRGDLLICEGGDAGRCAVWEDDREMFYQNALHRVRAKDNVYNHFLMYYLHYLKKDGTIDKLSKGVTIKHFTKTALLSLTVPLPPLSEQRAIAEELDGIQSMIGKCREQLEDYDRLARSIFHEMFGDPVKNDKGWEVKTLREISLGNGKYGAASPSEEYTGNRPRYIRITDIDDFGNLNNDFVQSSKIEDDEQYALSYGDILFARTGATVGKTYIYKGSEAQIYAGYLIRFQLNKDIVMPIFAFYCTKTDAYKTWVSNQYSGAAQPNINAQKYAALCFPLPPLPLQQQFASRIESIEAMKEATKAQLADLQQLFDSRMQYYFS